MNWKVEEAKQYKAEKGGAIPSKQKPKKKHKFHDPIHRHLHHHLSGRGGRLDPPYVRKKMHELTKNMHPSVFNSYMKGSYHSLPLHLADHPGRNIHKNKMDAHAHVIDTGGSMSSLTHSENGILSAHDSTFYHQSEII